MDILEIAKVLSAIGTTGLLALALIGGYRQLYAFSWYVKELRADIERERAEKVIIMEDRDAWRQVALGNLEVPKEAIKLVKGAFNAK